MNDEKLFKEFVRRVFIFKWDILDVEINKLKIEGLIEELVSFWLFFFVFV